MFSLEDELNGPMEDLDLSTNPGPNPIEESRHQHQQQRQRRQEDDPFFLEELDHHQNDPLFLKDEEIPPPPIFNPPPLPSSAAAGNEKDDDEKFSISETARNATPSMLLAALTSTAGGNDEDDLFGIGDIEEDEVVKEEEDEEELGQSVILTTTPTSSLLDPLNAILMEERQRQREQHQYVSSSTKSPFMGQIPPTPISTPMSSPRPAMRSNPHAGLNIPNSSTILPTIPLQQQQQPALDILPPLFSSVLVSNPTFVKDSLFGFNLIPQGSYWLYTVTSTPYQDTTTTTNHSHCNDNINGIPQEQQQKVVVLRRFRHFVALEDRLRRACPGAILPPRPDKRQMDAQPQNFAQQRCQELTKYLNGLIQHPIAGRCRQELGFFLTFTNDDLGTAWLEVSSNALTRLKAGVIPKTWDFLGGAVGGPNVTNSTIATTPPLTAKSSTSSMFLDGAAESMWVGGGTSRTNLSTTDLSMVSTAPTEENAYLYTLQNYELMRLATVCQAIPKLDGGLTLLMQHKEYLASTAMELSKLSRDLLHLDQPLTLSFDVVSKAMLKSSRRKTRWLHHELKEALVPYQEEWQSVRMERAAFQDRRAALLKRYALRQHADAKAQLLVSYHQQQHTDGDAPTIVFEGGKILKLDQLELEAAQSDEVAVEAMKYADHIGNVLIAEVARRKQIRHGEWMSSLKDIVYSMHSAHKDQVVIWEHAKNQMMSTAIAPSV
jgi:hypothetical protein